ncbi:hypothetical protein ACWCRD_22840 [Streptomyces sp. NPDC002092]
MEGEDVVRADTETQASAVGVEEFLGRALDVVVLQPLRERDVEVFQPLLLERLAELDPP